MKIIDNSDPWPDFTKLYWLINSIHILGLVLSIKRSINAWNSKKINFLWRIHWKVVNNDDSFTLFIHPSLFTIVGRLILETQAGEI